MSYRDQLNGVRAAALRDLLDRPASDPELNEARRAVMTHGPVPAILNARNQDGLWGRIGGAGYSPNKYRGSAWQVVFLANLGADGDDPRVRVACNHLLCTTQAADGGLSLLGAGRRSMVVHCFNGDSLYAVMTLRVSASNAQVRRALDWEAQAILGEATAYFKSGTTGPGFACAANGALPCAWGAIKALRALATVPTAERSALHGAAVEHGVAFLLSRDLAVADYPAWDGKVSSSWWRFGFPLSYTSDILEALDVLTALGVARDRRLQPAVELVLRKQDTSGRWTLEHTLNGKMWADIETRGQPSKWVTLRALRVLRSVFGD